MVSTPLEELRSEVEAGMGPLTESCSTTMERSTLPMCSKSARSMDQNYTSALLRGRHPRSFRSERGIYQYVKSSNKRANMGQKGQGKHQQQPKHHQRLSQSPSLDSLSALSSGPTVTNNQSFPSDMIGARFPSPCVMLQNKNISNSITSQDQQGQHQRQLTGESSASLPRDFLGGGGEQVLQSHKQQEIQELEINQRKPPLQMLQEQYQQQRLQLPSRATQQSGGGLRRRPRSAMLPLHATGKRPAAPRRPGDASNRAPMGGYIIKKGELGSSYGASEEGLSSVGGEGGVAGGIRTAGGGHAGQQTSRQGRAGDRPVSIHQRFNAMIGLHKEGQGREDEAQILDSLNDDALLRLHYGLHVTLQAVQGENGYFMALDMDTGGVSMRSLHGLKKNQQVTFKLIDLEDPESYRSIIYGRPVWLQIVTGPGEPTWKQGSVLGARVHGPGMLPTVVIDPSNNAALPPTGGGKGGGVPARLGTPKNPYSVNIVRSTTTAPASIGNGKNVGNAFGYPGGGGGWAEVAKVAIAGSGGEGASGVRLNAAVGGGNTDANRPVGVPYPFRAASTKHGDSSGGTNETVLRLINKAAMVNCRWIVRSVGPDGQSIPGKSGQEVSNMDYIYLEQDFFYVTRVSQNASVVLKALLHKPRLSGTPGGSKRRSAHKLFPVERRGVFQVQVADADELRPGEERSAALMRKAKRGLKRSEARRVGQRTYVHKDCSDDRLTSGASFPREIRVRTTLFATESESRAISSAACSPTRVAGEGSARAGSEEREGGEEEGTGSGWLTAPLSLSIASIPTESWGSKILQAMSDAARAPADSGVAANHARVLREWKQRLGSQRPSSSPHDAPIGSSRDSLDFKDGSSSNSRKKMGVVSAMCPRCRYISSSPSVPILRSDSANSVSSSSGTMTTLGRYCLCSVNQDIQRDVLQGNASGNYRTSTEPASPGDNTSNRAASLQITSGPPAGNHPTRGVGKTGEANVTASPVLRQGPGRPPSPAASVNSGGTIVGESPEGASAGPVSPEKWAGASGDIPSPRVGIGGQVGERGRAPSRTVTPQIFGEPSLPSWATNTLPAIGGLKRGRDRRADRRKKKDPFEALEARLLDGFGLESITRRLEQQDEILQKGVRHVERMGSRHNERGQRSAEEHQRYLLIQKKRFEAVAADPAEAPLFCLAVKPRLE